MRAKLLKKTRRKLPVFFDALTKKYRCVSVPCTWVSGERFEPCFEVEWTKDIKKLKARRREVILKWARVTFEDSLFGYKRKRVHEIPD